MKWTCELIEERLSEHLEGTLDAQDARSFMAHVGGCERCTKLVASVSNMLTTVQHLEPLPLPEDLEVKILKATLGPQWKRKKRWAGWLGWIQPVLQPRLAMGFATVIFGGFLTMQAAGVDVSVKDLTWWNVKRQAHLTYARSVKFVNDIRVVYEIQTRLQNASEKETDTDTKEKKEPDNNERRKRESNQLNARPCDLCAVAAIVNVVPGRSIR
jgi:anti-sigma factor RsiW